MVVSTVATSRCTIGHAATVAPDPSAATREGRNGGNRYGQHRGMCPGRLQERTFRCQAKPLSHGLVEAEENEDPSEELQHRWLRLQQPEGEGGPERLHQAAGFQQHQPANNVGGTDDQHGSSGAEVPARGREPVRVGCVIDEQCWLPRPSGSTGRVRTRTLAPGEWPGSSRRLPVGPMPARPETPPGWSGACRSTRFSTTRRPPPPR